jgi:hypothetical protein
MREPGEMRSREKPQNYVAQRRLLTILFCRAHNKDRQHRKHISGVAGCMRELFEKSCSCYAQNIGSRDTVYCILEKEHRARIPATGQQGTGGGREGQWCQVPEAWRGQHAGRLAHVAVTSIQIGIRVESLMSSAVLASLREKCKWCIIASQ